MSPTALLLILVAAVAHASWNLFSKQAAATGAACFAWLLAACAALIYLPVAAIATLVSHPHLTGLAWVFLAGTGVLHAGYFLFLQLGYATGDLSVAYPTGRGSGALLAAVAGIGLLGERLSALATAGLLAIIAGVIVIGLPARQRARQPDPALAGAVVAGAVVAGAVVADAVVADAAVADAAVADAAVAGAPALIAAGQPVTGQPVARQPVAEPGRAGRAGRTTAFALATGMFIACYTIWDKYAVADLRTPPLLQGYAGFVVMTLAFTPFALRDRGRLREVWRSFRPQVLGAAVLSPLAYLLVLVALSFTAVSLVAPAREISVLFGVLLGRRLLGEGQPARRLAAAAAIVAGIIAISAG